MSAPFGYGRLGLRAWTRADLARVCEIERRCFGDPWTDEMLEAELDNRRAHCLLAVPAQEAEAIGFVLYWLVEGEVQIHIVAVDPCHRRRGVARWLVGCALERAAIEGATLADLEVRASNTPARGLYRALGFSEVGMRRRYYSDGEDAIILQRHLGPEPPEAA